MPMRFVSCTLEGSNRPISVNLFHVRRFETPLSDKGTMITFSDGSTVHVNEPASKLWDEWQKHK